jgi:hypothetical protein
LAPCHWLGALLAGPVSDVIGSVGFVAVLKYFDPLALANVMLADQIVGNWGVRLIFHQVSSTPQLVTYVGTVLMMLGVLAIVLAGRLKITHFNVRLHESP